MSGIERIKIIGTWHDWRTEIAELHAHTADNIYKKVFNLADGVESIKVSKDEAMARYDWKEGIDIILTSTSGTRMTVQEKILTFFESTMTFEDVKTSGAKGAWYYCTAQYYFVGYSRKYWDWKNRVVLSDAVIGLQDWMIVDLPALHREDEKGNVNWGYKENGKDGRKSKFRFVNFRDVPSNCVIARM